MAFRGDEDSLTSVELDDDDGVVGDKDDKIAKSSGDITSVY